MCRVTDERNSWKELEKPYRKDEALHVPNEEISVRCTYILLYVQHATIHLKQDINVRACMWWDSARMCHGGWLRGDTVAGERWGDSSCKPFTLLSFEPCDSIVKNINFFCVCGTGVCFKLAKQKLYRFWAPPPVHFLWLFWRWGLMNYLPGLASNCDPPDLSLSSR
jgi:hypothetical protein